MIEVLKPYREQIDALDKELVALLAKRMDIIRQVAAIKGPAGISPTLHDRVDIVRENAVRLGEPLGLDPDYMRKLYTLIIKEACDLEKHLIEEAGFEVVAPE